MRALEVPWSVLSPFPLLFMTTSALTLFEHTDLLHLKLRCPMQSGSLSPCLYLWTLIPLALFQTKSFLIRWKQSLTSVREWLGSIWTWNEAGINGFRKQRPMVISGAMILTSHGKKWSLWSRTTFNAEPPISIEKYIDRGRVSERAKFIDFMECKWTHSKKTHLLVPVNTVLRRQWSWQRRTAT